MPVKTTPPSKSNIVNNPFVQDLFVDTVAGLHRSNGTLRVTLTAFRADHSKDQAPIQQVVVGRLVMSFDTATQLQKNLAQFIERTKKQLASGSSTDTIQ